ncbi:hypothetical protein CFC21_001050 [Triticum aestivum]|uniref:Uncharacterized protein n=1 Tax=Triticum aestivum TaxID=4565 RepID=A0A3B5XX16_WHEAT|nr:hypothetical protein CFC21_001050 [Triticum aestivum]
MGAAARSQIARWVPPVEEGGAKPLGPDLGRTTPLEVASSRRRFPEGWSAGMGGRGGGGTASPIVCTGRTATSMGSGHAAVAVVILMGEGGARARREVVWVSLGGGRSCVGTRDLRVVSYWIDTLVLKN